MLNGRIILDWMLEKQGGKFWTGCMYLKVGNSGRLLVKIVLNLWVLKDSAP
jgi:hypothetical protein